MELDINTPEIYDDSQYTDDPTQSIIKVIGVGGGGCNAVNYMFHQNIPNINYVVCNTDKQHLDKSPIKKKLLIGNAITKGLGAGNEPEVGKKCAESDEESIRQLFEDKTEMVFITAGMGGGTGTGAAPVVARIAKESGMLTIGIVTVPFIFEGEKKILKALNGADELKQYVDALLVINNENLVELYKDLNIINAFSKSDDTLANAARSISEIISEPCFINVDFQDVKTILKDSGTAIIATAYGEGEHRIRKAIENALHSPLLKSHDIFSSKRLLLKFATSVQHANSLKTDELNEITEFTSKLPPTIDVKWGFADNPDLEDKVKVTVLASGFDVTLREGEKGSIIMGAEAGTQKATEPTEDATGRIEEFYGAEKVNTSRRNAAKNKYVVLKPSQFDDHDVIALLEQVPTYNRDNRFNEILKKTSEPEFQAPSTHQPQNGNDRKISF